MHGQRVWDDVMQQYAIADIGGIELLCEACTALDIAVELNKERKHETSAPARRDLLKLELQYRAMYVRTLQRLGLDLEPIKAMGLPPNHIGFTPDAAS